MMIAEVPPLPPPAWAALATLLALVTLCFAYAMAQLADKICRAFFGTATGVLGHVPVVGKVVSKPIHAIEAKLTSYLDDAIQGLEAEIGVTWHRLARLVDNTGRILWRLSKSIYKHAALLSVVTGLWPLYKALRASVIGIAKLVHASKHLIHDLTRQFHGATTFVTHVVYPKVKAVAAPVEGWIPREIGRIRAKERTLEREIGKLSKREKGLLGLLGFGVFVHLLVRALTKLGLGWTRCSNVTKTGRRVCGMDSNLLDSLLLDTLAILGTVSVVEFTKAAQEVEGVALDALSGFIRELPRL